MENDLIQENDDPQIAYGNVGDVDLTDDSE